jgi:hypothetical protein
MGIESTFKLRVGLASRWGLKAAGPPIHTICAKTPGGKTGDFGRASLDGFRP